MIYVYECYFYGKIKNPDIAHYLAVEDEYIIYENNPHESKEQFLTKILNKSYKNHYRFRFNKDLSFEEHVYNHYGEFNKYILEEFINTNVQELL